jgi:formylglycine-generating enzyme required for sulfatase activity
VNRLLLASLTLLCAVLALPLAGADKPKEQKAPPKKITNSIGMKLVLIPAGKFNMGSPTDEEDRVNNEKQHEVEITKPFYLGVYTVTQKQYQKVMGKNPSHFCKDGEGKDDVKDLDTDDFPVENVSWQDVKKFSAKLSALAAEKKAGRVYRLPTEAEWEYACRAGTTTPFHFGKSLSSKQANFDGDAPYGEAPKGPNLKRTCKVGSYRPNAWGLYDMHGNVEQFCEDWYQEDYHKDKKRDPKGPKKGESRVLRGGLWTSGAEYCRAARRTGVPLDSHVNRWGFRVACDASKKP